jgi:hypothetical protein
MENLVQELGLKPLPGWALIALGLLDLLEKMRFIGEHVQFLTSPWGRVSLIVIGIAYLFILHVAERRRLKRKECLAPPQKHAFVGPQGIPLLLNGSRLEINLIVSACSQVELTLIELSLTANQNRPIPLRSPHHELIEPFKSKNITVSETNLSLEDIRVLASWPQLAITGKAHFGDGLEQSISFSVTSPNHPR